MSPQQFRESLRQSLSAATGGCTLQEAPDGSLWPCGTCTCALLASLLSKEVPEYHEHNTPPDRINEVWSAILQMRDGTPVDTARHDQHA